MILQVGSVFPHVCPENGGDVNLTSTNCGEAEEGWSPNCGDDILPKGFVNQKPSKVIVM